MVADSMDNRQRSSMSGLWKRIHILHWQSLTKYPGAATAWTRNAVDFGNFRMEVLEQEQSAARS